MSENERVPIGMWGLHHGLMDSYGRVAYWNPTRRCYEIETPKGGFEADTMLGLEEDVRAYYPQLKAIDYPTGAAIRKAAAAGIDPAMSE
jgi:hypothetical protein